MIGKELMNSPVSEGTLILEDIVDKISLLVSSQEIVDDSGSLDDYIDEFYEELSLDEQDQQNLDEIYQDICERLTDLAKDGYYFGGLEGDPACIGFWEIVEE